jgi:hypothetical protein
MALVKIPVPVPSTVLLSKVVGLVVVLQQTPRAVTKAPPSAPTVPPLLAVVVVISITAAVAERTGKKVLLSPVERIPEIPRAPFLLTKSEPVDVF